MKLLFGVLLGMLLHKTLNFVYDYSWNRQFDTTCLNQPMTNGVRFKCTEKAMGYLDYTKYLLYRPSAPNSFGYSNDKWTF